MTGPYVCDVAGCEAGFDTMAEPCVFTAGQCSRCGRLEVGIR